MLISPRTPRETDNPSELIVRDLSKSIGGKILWSNISFSLRQGETLFLRGPSGIGKSVLLRTLAFLDPIQAGTLTFGGHTPEQIGVPKWRALITLVLQQRIALKGTPSELYYTAQRFSGQRGRPRGDLPAIIHELGLEQAVLNQPWAELSGGQAQRVSIAIAVALRPAIILLDEPTSSLDVDSARRVERVLKNCGAGLLWVSHDPHQPARVGGRVLDLPGGIESLVCTPPASPAVTQPSSLPRTSTKHSPGDSPLAGIHPTSNDRTQEELPQEDQEITDGSTSPNFETTKRVPQAVRSLQLQNI